MILPNATFDVRRRACLNGTSYSKGRLAERIVESTSRPANVISRRHKQLEDNPAACPVSNWPQVVVFFRVSLDERQRRRLVRGGHGVL